MKMFAVFSLFQKNYVCVTIFLLSIIDVDFGVIYKCRF